MFNVGDSVTFTGKNNKKITYEVYIAFLNNNNLHSHNRAVFTSHDFLDLDDYSTIEFCTKYYSYKPRGGGWPEARVGDMEALNRLIEGVYKELGKKYPGAYNGVISRKNQLYPVV